MTATNAARTKEPQYDDCLVLRDEKGLASFGLMSNQVWHDDPRRLVFVLARYKFVAKMLKGRRHVLEVGCADAFGTRLVQQCVAAVTALDVDPLFIEDVRERMDPDWPLETAVHDMMAGPYADPAREGFDGAYALDVLEHIAVEDEDRFVGNIARSLRPDGALIVGMPSLNSQAYASPASKAGHVNCKQEDGLRTLMERHFANVFIFSMNDEVVHTGFSPLAHYFLALSCGPKCA